MNTRNDVSAQQKSVFTEVSMYRKVAQAAEKKAAALLDLIDAKQQGVGLKEYDAVRTALRNLLVANENQYLSTKDDKKKIPKEIGAAMEAAQKIIRPSTTQEVRLTVTTNGFRAAPANAL